MSFIQVDIMGLSASQASGGAYALVLGEVEGNRRMPIIIGAFEAQAIALELEKIQPPRPMTHDLIRDLFIATDAKVADVIIDELRDGTFYAKIRFAQNGQDLQLDARPSDAVALAIRVDAPIFVAAAVLEEAGIENEGENDSPDQAISAESDLPAEAKPKPITPSQKPMSRLEQMEQELAKAIASEEYEKAASLRDQITQLMKDGSTN